MNYINTSKKKFVNSVNMITGKKLSVDFAVTDQYSFALLDREGKKQDIERRVQVLLVKNEKEHAWAINSRNID